MLKYKKLSLWLAVFSLVVGLCSGSLPGHVRADTGSDPGDVSSIFAANGQGASNCGGATFASSATFSVPKDVYTVYARLGATTTPEADQLFVQNDSQQSCQSVGSATLTSQAWTKLGSFDATSSTTSGSFVLASYSTKLAQSFNQPSILLVSQINPVCQPTNECVVKIGQQTGVVRPGIINSATDTLFVVRAVNPQQDSIKKVTYFVDDRQAYSKPHVEPFDMHYVGVGQHKLSTVIQYNSGQRAIITRQDGHDWASFDIFSLASNLFYNQSGLLQYLFGLSILLLIVWFIIKLVRAVHHHERWRRDHDARITSAPLGERIQAWFRQRLHPHLFTGGSKVVGGLVWLATKIPLIFVALLVVVLMNRYVMRINQVDGPSMDSTFASGNPIFVNQLGQSFAHIAKKGYLPKRGDVVVFRRILDPLDPSSAQGSELVIKRVLGLPGEHIVTHDSTVTVYNKQHPSGFQPDKGSAWEKTMHTGSSGLGSDADVNVVLQPGQIFVCGDNRPDSVDSRSFGPISVNDIVGNVFLKL
jgi:signal peptidase I